MGLTVYECFLALRSVYGHMRHLTLIDAGTPLGIGLPIVALPLHDPVVPGHKSKAALCVTAKDGIVDTQS